MKRKHLYTFLAVLLASAFLVYGCAQETLGADEYRVMKVIDGDTVTLSTGEMVRYLSIDTPEIGKKVAGSWRYHPEPFSVESKRVNEGLVQGKVVRLEFDRRKQDKYGRTLAYVYVDNVMVNKELLKEGMAITYFIPPNLKHIDKLVAAQQEAMRIGRGLWRDVRTISPQETGRYIDKVCRVRGKVRNISRTSQAIYIEFGGRRDFKGVIFSRNATIFEKKGIFPTRAYHNKTIEVTGKVRDYDGPEIIIGHPFQIKILD